MDMYDKVIAQLIAKPAKWMISGVAGFIGSNLLEALLQLDQTVVGLDNFSTGKPENLKEVQDTVTPEQWERFTFIEGDTRDVRTCSIAMVGCDYVLHQAALGSVPRSIVDPLASNDSNVTGFLNMLYAAKEEKVKRFVYAASSSTYGDHPALPKKEEIIGRCLSPYAVTKYVNELYAGVFAKSYGFKTVGLRYFNVFGKRQNPHGGYAAVIPKWISGILNRRYVFINGDGKTSRDFCYIENVIQANLLAATTENPNAVDQVYNVAVGDRHSLDTLFLLLQNKLMARIETLAPITPDYKEFRKGDARHSQADMVKIETWLKYEVTHDLDEGLEDCIDWYIDFLKENKEDIC